MNYSKYFSSCSPSTCSYKTTDLVNWSYAITIFISLYGGLISILRFISAFFMKILFKFKNHSTTNHQNGRVTINGYLNQSIKIFKRMNLFKNRDQRSENQIKQQKIITRVYLILLFSMFYFN